MALKSIMTSIILFVSYILATQAKTEISCSVFLYGENDWYINPLTKQSKCINQVARVREYCGGSKLNFVPTLFWFDYNNDMVPEAYGTKFNLDYILANDTNIKIYRDGMSKCIQYAIQQKFTTIAVTPHLDDGSGKGGWRNALILNPLQKYDGKYSYYDVVIKPLVDAFKFATGTNTNVQIYFAMQGEMNLMVWKYPMEWLRMLKAVKCLLPNNPKTGISLNFNKMCGMNSCDLANVNTTLNITGAQLLMNNIDFLGISSYPEVTPELTTSEFQGSAFILEGELRMMGIEIQEVLRMNPNMEFHFSEFGIGGAGCDSQLAPNVASAGRCPFFGVFEQYKEKTDPWKSLEMKTYLAKYYTRAVQWAAAGTGPTFKVSQVYVWNVASWDAMGIYHDSTSISGTYRNMDVVRVVKDWNDKGIVRAA